MLDGLFQMNLIPSWVISYNLIWQLTLIYVLWLLLNSRNVFYSLTYMFVILVFLGIFIAYYQMELYTGFLWVAEFSVVLVFLILVIYLNTDGYSKHLYNYSRYKLWVFCSLVVALFFFFHTNQLGAPVLFLADELSIWDDYYGALTYTTTNDFNGLFLSYYTVNSMEFLLFAMLLLFGTFLCVALFKVFFTVKLIPYGRFFSIFDFFRTKTNYNFLRQQNLHKQTSAPAATRVVRKK